MINEELNEHDLVQAAMHVAKGVVLLNDGPLELYFNEMLMAFVKYQQTVIAVKRQSPTQN